MVVSPSFTGTRKWESLFEPHHAVDKFAEASPVFGSPALRSNGKHGTAEDGRTQKLYEPGFLKNDHL